MNTKKFGIKLVVASVFAILIGGCASTGIIELDRGVYYISEQSYGAFGPPNGEIIKKVYSEANQFCAKKGKVVQSIKKISNPMRVGVNASFILEFRCVNK